MSPPSDFELLPEEVEACIERLQAACDYFKATLNNNPTTHDLHVALRGHAQACKECAVILDNYLNEATGGAE